ncbi:hypothetical protein ACLOJK_033278 [Asimina triloba]
MEDCEQVVIVGAGIAGLATALALKRVGVQFLVLEKWNELRSTGAAISLFPNAWRALDALGVAHKLTSIYPVFDKAIVTDVATGAVQTISLGGTSNCEAMGWRTVHRRALLKALADEIPPNSIRFSSKIVSISTETAQNSPIYVLHMADGTIVRAKVLIGCDGVHSMIAEWLGLSTPVHSGRVAVRGLAVFPEGHGLNHEVLQFVGYGQRAGFVPITSKEVYWFVTYKSSLEGHQGPRDPELIKKDVLENMTRDLPQVFLDVVHHCDLATLTWAPLVFRYPWDVLLGPTCKGAVTVAGDAMHPMTPDLGQGGCSALEDAVVLGRHIGNSLLESRRVEHGKVKKALEGYVKERKWRAAWLIAGAYMSGWAQQAGSGWLETFVRDKIFYAYVFSRLARATRYDCGALPSVPSAGYKLD